MFNGDRERLATVSLVPGRIRLLLVEDSTADAFHIRTILNTLEWAHVTIERTVQTLVEATAAVLSDEFDAILLDLNLPDSFGVETLEGVFSAAPGIPVIVLTGLADEQLALMAMERGAQDYLVKGEFDARLLVRTIKYGIQRQRLVERLTSSRATVPGDLVDAVTGLQSRSGFFHLAEHHLKLAERTRSEGALFLFVVETSKEDHETPGSDEARGAALQGMAALLRQTFRGTDILARIGVDEFAVLALGTTEDAPKTITQRLRGSQEGDRRDRGDAFRFAYSVRQAVSTPDTACTLADLVSRAVASPALRCSGAWLKN